MELNENENAILVFDDILGSSNNRFLNPFFIRRHKKFRYMLSITTPF